MNTTISGTRMPDHITHATAWDAYSDVIERTDWRVTFRSRQDLTFDIEGETTFNDYLNASPSWKTRDEAQHLIAKRLIELAHTDLNKTSIRRWSLQIPDPDDDTTEFLACLKDRLIIALRIELNAHYRQSLPRWEAGAFAHWGRMRDDVDQHRFYQFSGLDQVVPLDVSRKATKFVFNHLNWAPIEEAGVVRFYADYRTDQLRKRRFAPDDQTRARGTVLRAVDSIWTDWVTRSARGEEMAPMTRFWLRDTIYEAFERYGCWGAIHLALKRDRYLYNLVEPDLSDPETKRLIEEQDERLFQWG